MISAARGMAVGDANIRAGKFQMGVPVGIGLAGKTMGIMGLGRLGGYMATYCLALRMKVIAWSTNLTEERAYAMGAKLVSKDELMAQSDAISIHLVLSGRSRGVAQEVAAWRDRHAAALDRPRRHVLSDLALLAIAQRPPQSRQELQRTRGVDARHLAQGAAAEITAMLEQHYKDMQDFEFTVQDGVLYMLQTRNGKRTGPAAVKVT